MYPAKQIEESVRFILENEDYFPNLTKNWVLHRIADPAQCKRLHSMLTSAGQTVVTNDFDGDLFKSMATDEERYLYLAGVNTARNMAITMGLQQADVVLPVSFDTMIRHDGWGQFVWYAEMEPDDPYYALGTWHGADTEEVLGKKPPILREDFILKDRGRVLGMTEPKIAFTRNSDMQFDETIPYGDFDNIEILWRLGVMGCWDQGHSPMRAGALKNRSKAYGQIPISAWLYKLPSIGANNVSREMLKEEGRKRLLQHAKHLTGM
jgi:hypothetical protein